MEEERTFNILELEHHRTQEFRQVYTNSAILGANFFDVHVVFGEIIQVVPKQPPIIEDRVAVTMSWEHAKALAESLQRAIADYERVNDVRIRERHTRPAEATAEPTTH